MLFAQVVVLLLVLGAGFALTAVLLRDQAERQYIQRALAVGRTTADTWLVIDRIESGKDPEGSVQQEVEHIRRRTGMHYIVVTDAHGIRYSDPNPCQVGKPVSAGSSTLSEQESVWVQEGGLDEASAKVPVTGANGRVIGEVAVGIQLRTADSAAAPKVWAAALFACGVLLLGTAAAVQLARWLKRQTLGLEPADLANLLRKHEAVIGGVGDGVLAVDDCGNVTVCNAEASRLLGGTPSPGTPMAEAGIPTALLRVLSSRQELRQSLLAVGDRLLVVTAQPVRRGDQDLGHVLTLRDRTEMDELERELAGLRALSDALRAQAHEYTNRLHTLSGLLAMGAYEEAEIHLRELSASPLATESRDGGRIVDPYLRGLLAAKTAVASERGIELRLMPGSHLPRRLTDPLSVVTLVGNLLDNATRAAAEGSRVPAWVELDVLAEEDTLHVAVVDSGDGVPADVADRLFAYGFTTRPDSERAGHGLGLPLARQLVAKHDGELKLERRSGPDHGAVFIARVPEVVEPPGSPDGFVEAVTGTPSRGAEQ